MSQIASIRYQNKNEICFKVDDVKVFKNLLPLQTCFKQLEERLDSSLIAFSHEESFQVVEQSNENDFESTLNLHSLVNAVHQEDGRASPFIVDSRRCMDGDRSGFCCAYQ